MSLQQFAVYSYASQVSYGSGIFYADVRATAEQFAATGKNVIHRSVKSLEADGWLILIRPPLRENDGTFSCAQYRVISHKDWARSHPGRCVITCPNTGTGCASTVLAAPVPPAGHTCPKTDVHLSHQRDKVLEKKALKNHLKREETERASTQTVLAPQACVTEDIDVSIFDEPVFKTIEHTRPDQKALPAGNSDARFDCKGVDQSEQNRQKQLLQQWAAGRK